MALQSLRRLPMATPTEARLFRFWRSVWSFPYCHGEAVGEEQEEDKEERALF